MPEPTTPIELLNVDEPLSDVVKGWSLANASVCPVHGVGLILVVSPEQRAAMEDENGEGAVEFVECFTSALRNMIRRQFDIDVPEMTIFASPPPEGLGPQGN